MSEDKVNEFMKDFTEHGLSCGEEIAEYLKKKHPKAQVLALYRSAIAFEKDEKQCFIRVFACGDPHAMGEDLTGKTLESWESQWIISGDRFGPTLYKTLGKNVVQQIVL